MADAVTSKLRSKAIYALESASVEEIDRFNMLGG
jgi:hypothetical protein